MAKTRTMQDLLIGSLRDIYDGERRSLKAMPKLARAATDERIKQAFEQHQEETQEQIERLVQIFETLDVRVHGSRCQAVEGLIEEAKEVLEMDLPPELLDAALIAAQQKIEHYEIACYGTVHAFAEAMGETEIAKLLEQTLDEERSTDEKLNRLAVEDINQKALKAA
ncbi:DUF892 family protein [Azospirillum sp. SYSU D00513]|uniref:YciE/YciF ferroxidase family protein n=1 Tax=Azospirillum sp. SYSU D00513 TaxID=2812561 RepID=UPI001A95A58F|nr:DUF892 family protein [Azospirillum sp. SYSU D00513]